jgi:ankyrin repeat protein
MLSLMLKMILETTLQKRFFFFLCLLGLSGSLSSQAFGWGSSPDYSGAKQGGYANTERYSDYSGRQGYSNYGAYQNFGRYSSRGSSGRFSPVISLDLNHQDHLDTAFRIAIRENRIEDAKALLDHGANPAIASETGRTSLMYAARNCSLRAIDLILTRQIKVNEVDRRGRTALMYAAMQACDLVVDRLLNIPGIHLNAKDLDGKTAANYAREGGLLEYGGGSERMIHRLNAASQKKMDRS